MHRSVALALLGLVAGSAFAQLNSTDDSSMDSSSSDDTFGDDSGPTANATMVMPQGPVVTLFMLNTDPQPLVASVVNAAPSATTYVVNCVIGTDSSDCGIYNATVTAAPSAWDFSYADGDAFSESVHCSMTSSTIPGTCSDVATGTEANFPGTSIYVPQSTDFNVLPVTVTAGTEKLASASATPTSSGSKSGSSSTGTANSGSSGANKAGTSATGSSASSSASATGNAANQGGAPMFGAAVGAAAAILMF